MQRIINLFLIWISVVGLCSCALGPVAPAKWDYEKDALTLRIKADRQLNLYGGKPHTLQLCIYQLKDPNSFNQLIGDEDGLYNLLECALFDESVSTTKRFTIQPGKDLVFTLDRSEGARYIGIVAGYNTLDGKRMTRLYDIPITMKKKGWFIQSKYYIPISLNMDMTLDPQQIQPIRK